MSKNARQFQNFLNQAKHRQNILISLCVLYKCTLFRKAFILSGSCLNKSSAFAFSFFVKTQRIRNKPSNFTNFFISSMFEQKLFNLPCWPDINEHAAKEISQWSDLVEPLDWFPPLLCKIIWLYNRKFVKLLGLFLIRCVFTKKNLGGQKFVKTGTGKNRGFPEHCALYQWDDNVNNVLYFFIIE